MGCSCKNKSQNISNGGITKAKPITKVPPRKNGVVNRRIIRRELY